MGKTRPDWCSPPTARRPSKSPLRSRTYRSSDDGTIGPPAASKVWTPAHIQHHFAEDCAMHIAGYFGGLVVLALVLPVVADDKPASPPPPPATNNNDAKKYVKTGEMFGKLDKVTTDSSEAVLEYRAGLG